MLKELRATMMKSQQMLGTGGADSYTSSNIRQRVKSVNN